MSIDVVPAYLSQLASQADESRKEERRRKGCHARVLTLNSDNAQPEKQTLTRQSNHVSFCGGIKSITRSYYRNSVGGFLVFDITNRRSFEHVKDWLEEAKMHVQPFRIVFLLVGHKCDLASQRQVTREEAERLSADCGMKYIETSAKDATNVEESFTILTRDIYELIKRGEICIQDGWEGVKSGFVPNTVHSSEEAVKPRKECFC
ncbi:ras-related protein Rab-39A isoform X2 [Camelus dromedarius]|uniref:ras-related protein Rab-39A isoform X2 n=1 Tax=Camelus dromedarius TaxID=9838 RepID=UPI0010F2E2E6